MTKLFNQIIKKKWYRKNFEGTAFALYQWQILASYQKRDKLIKAKFKEVLTITSDHKVDYFWNQEDLLKTRGWLVKNIRVNSKFAPGWRSYLSRSNRFARIKETGDCWYFGTNRIN